MKRSIDMLTGAVTGAGLVVVLILLTRSCAAAELGVGLVWDGRSLAASARLSGDFVEWGIQVGDRVRSHLIVHNGYARETGLNVGIGVMLGEWEPMATARLESRQGYIAVEVDSVESWIAAIYRPIKYDQNVSAVRNSDKCPPPNDHPPPCI